MTGEAVGAVVGMALTDAFRAWGRLCASHAPTVIVLTILGALYTSLTSFNLSVAEHGQHQSDGEVCTTINCPDMTKVDEVCFSPLRVLGRSIAPAQKLLIVIVSGAQLECYFGDVMPLCHIGLHLLSILQRSPTRIEVSSR